MTSPSKKYMIVQYVRHDSPMDHGAMSYREALDIQLHLNKCEGTQRPEYMYRIEEYKDDVEVKKVT